MTSDLPRLIVFCSHLLPPSQTFILEQAESLCNFVPHYVGTRFVPGIEVPAARTFVINNGTPTGKLLETAFILSGRAPSLCRRVRRFTPVLVHAHFGPDGLRALPLAKSLGLPLVVTYHGFDATISDEYAAKSPFYGLRTYLRRKDEVKRGATRIIAISKFIARKLVEQGFPEDKVVVHYIGVDTRRFHPDPATAREPVVLFVGRLVEKKGCEYLIRAMAEVQEQHEAELVVIGDGELRGNLEKLASGTLRRYRFLGTQPPDVVRGWMNRARVFSVPSLVAKDGDAEGLGIVMCEAQAMGLPIVSTTSGGIPEAVKHGETGFLAAERAPGPLGTYISLLLTNSDLWTRMSLSARNRAVKHFDLHAQTAKLEQIYYEAIGTGNRLAATAQSNN